MELTLRRAYNGKKVLITGHTGFKGSWLSLWLKKLGAEVYGISRDIPTNPSLFEQLELEKELTHIVEDVKNFESIKNSIKKIKPDVVFHLAAQSIVSESFLNPLDTVETNFNGTLNLLESIRQLNLPVKIVCVSTDKCYENKEWLFGYREDDPMGGHDPYSASKGAMEIIVSSFARSFFNPQNYDAHSVMVASVRAGNVIGGGDWADNRLIPDCYRAIQQNESIELRNPSSVRPWQHVLDPLGGYLLLGSRMINAKTKKEVNMLSSAFNFGPLVSSNRSVRVLVKKFLDHWEYKNISLEKVDGDFHEANLLNLSITKAYHELGWYPVWKFTKTVNRTYDWYKTHYNEPEKAHEVTEKQIDEYLKDWRRLDV